MPLQATSGAASYDAFGGGVPVVPNYIEDVFSTYLYAGTGANQTIVNDIDLAGKGGLAWVKNRTSAGPHVLVDTARGNNNFISSNNTDAQTNNSAFVSTLNSNGFSVGVNMSDSGKNFASWTFRKQAKFFDVVTFTGDGVDNRAIPHSLGSVPGCMILKATVSTTNLNSWAVYHRSLPTPQDSYLILNSTTASQTYSGFWGTSGPDATNFYIDAAFNESGKTYVVYLFAHNAGGFGLTGTDNVISCGSFTTDGSGNATVNLGYEPQWVLWKKSDGPVDGYSSWTINDNMRGFTVDQGSQDLYPNSSSAEAGTGSGFGCSPTSTGFKVIHQASKTYIYIAIRRGPMKVPTVGTSVFAPFNTSVTSKPLSFTSNFPVDFALTTASNKVSEKLATSRLQGGAFLDTTSTAAETVSTFFTFDSNTKISSTYWNTGFGSVQSMLAFQRAPSFFDEVCYTGSGSATTQTHNLGVAPELMIVKMRSATSATGWIVYAAPLASAATSFLVLNLTDAVGTGNSVLWNSTAPTSTVFSLGASSNINTNGATNVAYLFATCAGVSKVGSYTGTGALQTVNCGFGAGGSRFVLVKRTDSTGDWYVWDSARGMVSGTDPSLLLNSTAAEVNANSVYAVSTGFQIVSTAAGINASGGSYIFLSIS
jgi:hypothetical protein